MTIDVWITIQSDFGITLGSLGTAPASADSNMIGGTLLALKDIVAVEASSGSSEFMTGKVEQSSFGVFAINISDESKIIINYIISANKGSAVNEDTESLVQAVCTNLGKQLAQYGFLIQTINAGAQIHHSALVQAFLNACTIVKLERNIGNDKKVLRKSGKQIVYEFLNNPDQLPDLYSYILGNDWEKDDSRWSLGLLSAESYEYLMRGLSYHLVYMLVLDSPLALLYTQDPRNEHERLQKTLVEELELRTIETLAPITAQIDKTIEKNLNRIIKSIPSSRAHAIESNLYAKIIQNSIAKAVKTDPLILLGDIDRYELRDYISKKLPDLELENVSSILFRAVSRNLNGVNPNYVELFFKSYMEGLGEAPVDRSAMDVMLAFAQNFIEGKQLVEEIKKLEDLEKNTVKEVSKMVSGNKVDRLNVDSIDEAVSVTNAASNALVNVLAEIIIDQFLIRDKKPGRTVTNLIRFYLKNGPIIKVTETLVRFFNLLSDMETDVNLVVPTFHDFFIASVMDNGWKMDIDDEDISLKDDKSGYLFDYQKTKEPYDAFVDKGLSINLKISSDISLKITLKQPKARALYYLLNKPDIFVSATRIATIRRIHLQVDPQIKKWLDQIQGEFNNAISTFEDGRKQTVNIVTGHRFSLPPNSFKEVNLGEQVSALLTTYSDSLLSIWRTDVTEEWDKITQETRSKGEPPKKIVKRIEKIAEKFMKDIEKGRDEFDKGIEEIIVEAEKQVRKYKSKIKEILWPDYDEILAYTYNSSDLLPSTKSIRQALQSIIEDRDGLKPEDFELLILNVSLTIFNKPPDSVFEPAYNEIISGKRSKAIKQALSKVKDRKEFEQYLQEQGQKFASNIYQGLTELINLVNSVYINTDGIVTSGNGKVSLQIGRLPTQKFYRYDILSDIFNFPGIAYTRETDKWLISFEIFELAQTGESEVPTIVTFSDAVKFRHRLEFEKTITPIANSLTRVASMIETGAGRRIEQIFENLKEVLYTRTN